MHALGVGGIWAGGSWIRDSLRSLSFFSSLAPTALAIQRERSMVTASTGQHTRPYGQHIGCSARRAASGSGTNAVYIFHMSGGSDSYIEAIQPSQGGVRSGGGRREVASAWRCEGQRSMSRHFSAGRGEIRSPLETAWTTIDGSKGLSTAGLR